jgi:phosphoserine phosphatase
LERVPGSLKRGPGFWTLSHDEPLKDSLLAELRAALPFDINPLPEGFDPERVGLLVSDLDSTLITIECIDELAARAGKRLQVSAITDAAMRGELEFATALQRRVALLEGLAVEELQRVYERRLRFNHGAMRLMAEAERRGVRTALVSGGFDFFADRVRQRLGMDYALANHLEVCDERLTGRLQGNLIGAQEKAAFLEELRQNLGLETSQCIAMGDGANDLPMLAAAGLGVAYHAKPKVQAAAQAVINHGNLAQVCHFFRAGYA